MRPRSRWFGTNTLLSVAVAVLVTGWLAGAGMAQVKGSYLKYVPDECIIRVKSGTTPDSVRQQVDRMGASLLKALPLSDYYLIKLGRGVSTGRMKGGVATPVEWTIEYWQPNYIMRKAAVPNDEYWSKLWGLTMINAPAAWDIEKGDENVKVAVLDTGVANHPDLAGRLLRGRDFVEDDDDPSNDINGHGTHVAGTIAAQGNNSAGVVGVCWDNVKILPVRVMGDDGSGATADILEGLDYAGQQGAHVVNMSIGYYVDDPAVRSAVQSLTNAGIVVVAAAGNDNTDFPHYPSGWPEVISVASVGPYEAIAPYSNYGKIEIAAPGGDQANFGNDGGIWSTGVTWGTGTPPAPAFGYVAYQGTSMACPHVAGAAALLLSNGVPAADVRNRLLTSARAPSGSFNTAKFGAGILDLRAAIANASIKIVRPVKGSTVLGATDFKISILGVDTSTIKVYLDYPDNDDNGVPDNLGDTTFVVVDGTNVNSFLNTSATAVAFSWPLPGRTALAVGEHKIYVTADSIVDGTTVTDWGVFSVSNQVIKAGVHLFAFPYWKSAAGAVGSIPATTLPSDLLLDVASGSAVRFPITGTNRAALMRWLPETSVMRSAPYFAYTEDKAAAYKSLPERLAWDNPQALSWNTGGGYSASSPSTFKFPAGSGFWLYLPRDAMINHAYTALEPNDAFSIHLYEGWNMIGNPFAREVSWGSVLFTYRGDGPKTLQQAEAVGWLKSTLYKWNGASGRYEYVTATNMLEPYNGYWLRASVGSSAPGDSLILTILP